MTVTVSVSAKGQLVIPAVIRKRYALKPKSKVEVLDTGHSIIIRPCPTGDPFVASWGMLKGKISVKEFLAMRRQERTRKERRLK